MIRRIPWKTIGGCLVVAAMYGLLLFCAASPDPISARTTGGEGHE